MYREMELTGK